MSSTHVGFSTDDAVETVPNMGSLFKRFDSTLEEIHVPLGELRHHLPWELDLDTRVSLDTETSGLYVDGDWHSQPGKCSPPARVSVVSIAWYDESNVLNSLSIPFDQGRVTGKPGAYSHITKSFEPLTPLCKAKVTKTPKSPGGSLVVCGLTKEKHHSRSRYGNHTYEPDEPDYNFGVQDWRDFNDWLMGRALVFHNAKFDMHMMYAGTRYASGRDLSPYLVWDTQLVNGVTEPLKSSSLKPTAERLWGEQEGDEQRQVLEALKRNGTGLTKRYDLIDWAIIGPYAGKDAELTIRLAHRQWAMIDEGSIDNIDTKIITETELPLANLLYQMEQRGIGFDAEGMRHEAQRMHDLVQELETALPFQPANITGAKTYFFETLGIPPIKVTAEGEEGQPGSPSLDAEVVARLVSDDVPGAVEWQQIAQLKSALGKWYDRWPNLIGHDGRLRTNFRQGRTESDRPGSKSGGAISGRLSAERVQTQGVPREWSLPKGIRHVKSFVTAKPGYQVWELDQSNAEVRVAAWLSRCKSLAQVINSGVNIHDGNTRMMFGIDKDHPQWEMYRTICKTTIFGDLYGAGVRTLKGQIEAALKQQGIMVDFSEAKVRAFKEQLNDAYPELRRTSIMCQRKADKGMGGCGYVRLVNGRRRVFGWAERTHKAFNACIQGGVAEAMKIWMLQVEDQWPGTLINQVHDSLWLELPISHASEVVQQIQHQGEVIFEQHFSLTSNPITFKVDAKPITKVESE